ncbi:MAG: hypothetical protein A3C55_02885 [Gammaproteobacteria bacterium RIFCSPHIGHO2_02_FULL_42_13]|nr:MAG: hypothetical protein A3C55_02885 [Gammaproteobacteria bacterium RIFCSPHIGHO2_02_FULL_42_13]OGT68168.1 MAG: hypothetical protein A3H43_02520 [Gammaproteobacteria bacterium RIFCSPLOWO2_02_FULL_42_9]
MKFDTKQESFDGTVSSEIDSTLYNFIKYLPGCIYLKDINGRYLACSDYLLTDSALASRKIVIGQADHDLFDRHYADQLRQNDLQVIDTHQTIVAEETIRLSDHVERIYQVIKAPFYDNSGELIGIIGNSINITSLKQTQAALQNAKEKAEIANQAKSNFLATISHEFRTPLNAIFVMAQILAEQNLTKDQQSAINTILDSSQHLTKLINDILVFAKIEANKIQLHYELLDFHHLISSTVTNISHQLENQSIQLNIHYDHHVPKTMLSDANALRQILINLLSNAIKFTDTGEITVSVEKMDSTRQIKVSVSDTGIGISAEFLPHAFDRFTQLDSSYTRKHMGSGLGLSICKNLVELMKGDIGINSTENKGTTVWFTFPLDESNHTFNTEETKKTPPLVKLNNTKVKKKHLLIIEDDLLNQKVLTTFLSQLGCTFEIASTGKQAITLFEKSNFDIVLSDLGLPDISGIDVIKHIRTTKKGKNLPIIALTAHAFKEDADSCLQAGANEVITKPIVLSTLQSVIQQGHHVSTA